MSYAVYCEDNYDHAYITEDTIYSFRESLEAVYDKEVVGDKRVEKLLDTKVLIVNLLYYIAAFPDALVDGAPTDKGGIQALPKKSGSIVIKTHPDVIESKIPGSRVTHFRHGHYRFLKNDRFVNLQGKFVFVRSTIVHGAPAKTVIG